MGEADDTVVGIADTRVNPGVPMSQIRDIAVIVGSLRKQSFNRKTAHALIELAPPPLKLEIVQIGQLPLYNQDFEADGPTPAEYAPFRERIRRADGVIFVTPEYNRSIPGVLKNAIDVGARPYGHSVWGGKPGAIVSVSPGAIGGFGANHHLRQCCVFLDILMLQQPEMYIGGADKLFDEAGRLVNESTRKYLGKFAHAYAKWVERILAP